MIGAAKSADREGFGRKLKLKDESSSTKNL